MILLRIGNLFELLNRDVVASVLFLILAALVVWVLARLGSIRIFRVGKNLYGTEKQIQP